MHLGRHGRTFFMNKPDISALHLLMGHGDNAVRPLAAG
jgi:hypothetical protein